VKIESVMLNCSWDEITTKQHTCASGQKVSIVCNGTQTSRRYTCESSLRTDCSQWDGTRWSEDNCYTTSTSATETKCECITSTSIGEGDSTTEAFLDFGAVTASVASDFVATLSVAKLLSPSVIAKNIVSVVRISREGSA
jgi:hypothetical protein